MLTCSFNEVALPSFQACSGALHVNKTGSNMARPERLGDLGDTTQVSTISKAPLLSGVRRGPEEKTTGLLQRAVWSSRRTFLKKGKQELFSGLPPQWRGSNNRGGVTTHGQRGS